MNIYATTASNASEDSYAFYCPDFYPFPPPEYTTCLGDAYSISWLEDSDKNDMTKETLHQQYETVRRRTLASNINAASHVMQYGDRKFINDFLATYIGAPPGLNDNPTSFANASYSFEPSTTQTRLISQRDAHLLHLRLELQKAPDGSKEKLKAQKELDDEIAQREHVDNVVHLIGDLLFREENSSTMMLHVRPAGQPLVDDWDCFKTLIKTYESHCGTLSSYGRKYSRAFANMCNAGISQEQMVAASLQACPKENHAS
ncbi:Vacuolar-processing enzyme [Spatholobus suberectus]|nr:Vacuolar-processing enzyme [Spatholobus suberectus]